MTQYHSTDTRPRMSQRTNTSKSKRHLSPIGKSDDEVFNNAPNVLSGECITKVDEGIEWVVDFCDKTMAESKDRKMSSEEDLKEDDSECDIYSAFRRNHTNGKAPLRSNRRAGKITETLSLLAMPGRLEQG